MDKLFYHRQNRQFLQLMKYCRLVFNDQFTIALFFIIGAFGYTYAQWIKTLTPGVWWLKLIVMAWFVLTMQVGRLATFIKPADAIFLLPQVKGIQKYIKDSFIYSAILGIVMSSGLFLLAWPLLMLLHQSPWQIGGVVVVAILTKLIWLDLSLAQISLNHDANQKRMRFGQWLAPLIMASLVWLNNIYTGLGCAWVILAIVSYDLKNFAINWRQAVVMEQKRLDRIYRFFNLFTDVPSVKSGIKRRKWANSTIDWLTQDQHAWSYLYARGLVRNTEISGLVSRLTLVGMVVTFFIPIDWLRVVVALLFNYLVAMQLMTLVNQYDNNVFTHIYPINKTTQLADFKTLLTRSLLLVTVLLSIATLGIDFQRLLILVPLALGILENYWLIQTQLKKFKK